MFDITKLALKVPNFLTFKECDDLINEFKQRKSDSVYEGSLNYKTNQPRQSTFKVVSLNPYTHNFNLIKKKTKDIIDLYINYLDQPKYFFTFQLKHSLRFSHSYRIMEYKTQSEIHPHSDHDPGVYGSVSFNLNDNYEGGEFKFFNGNYTVSLKKGDALIFPADYFWVHEVTPVTKGTRYSLNSFLTKYPKIPNEQGNNIKHNLCNGYISNTPKEELLGPYN